MPKNEIQPQRPYDKFVQYITERAVVESGDWSADELTADQVESILTAGSEDELFAAMKSAGLTGLRDLENGQEIVIQGYRLVRGSMGIGVYAVIDATDPVTGEEMALDTGIPRVIAFLRMAEQLDLFPVHVVVVKKTTSEGNTMISLARPPKRSVSGTAV